MVAKKKERRKQVFEREKNKNGYEENRIEDTIIADAPFVFALLLCM